MSIEFWHSGSGGTVTMETEGAVRPVKILLVEDSLPDIEIMKRAIGKGVVPSELCIVRDGEEALNYLYRRGKFKNPETSPRPGMVLLDLNLPKVGGMEVLRQIKEDRQLRSIPVVVLTASSRNVDIVRSYDLGVNTYVEKPVEFDKFLKVMHSIQEYWTYIAKLPAAHGADS